MMKIVWVCSIPLNGICDVLGINRFNTGSWLNATAQEIQKDETIKLFYVFPQKIKKATIEGRFQKIQYYGYYNKANAEESIRAIIGRINPDVLHVYGTESQFALDAIRAFGKPEKTIVNIQGLSTAIARHYADGVPTSIINRKTIRDIVRRNNIKSEIVRFEKCAKTEQEVICNSKYIVGRTDFDKAIVTQINPSCEYLYCPELLREQFYINSGKWKFDLCEKHSIMVSQAHYPVKGFHFLLEAVSIVKRFYPDVTVYVAGNTIRIVPKTKYDGLIQGSYAKYVYFLIKRYELIDNIVFTGSLDAEEMINLIKKSNVFVSASTIENSSNSLCEAKMIGIPCIASFVGGVTSLLEHKRDGILYPANEPYMLAHYIMELFESQEYCEKLSSSAVRSSMNMHDVNKTLNSIVTMYREIVSHE